MDHGYAEALIRSLRKSFLMEPDYTNLRNCQTLDDFKLVLEETDYNDIVSGLTQLESADFAERAKQKLADEFQHIIAQSVEPLTSFLQMLLHGYMIENVINIIEGLKQNSDIQILLKRADPLGKFPELKNLRQVDADDYGELYQTVLIDLPIGLYFGKFLANEDANSTEQIAEIMKELKAEKIKHLLKKVWFTELFKFVEENLNDTSKEVIGDLLKYESDCMTIQIIYNTLGVRQMTGSKERYSERQKFINSIGYLHPDRSRLIADAENLQ